MKFEKAVVTRIEIEEEDIITSSDGCTTHNHKASDACTSDNSKAYTDCGWNHALGV